MGRMPPPPVPKLGDPIPLASLLAKSLNEIENERDNIKFVDEEGPADGSLQSIKYGRSKEVNDPNGNLTRRASRNWIKSNWRVISLDWYVTH